MHAERRGGKTYNTREQNEENEEREKIGCWYKCKALWKKNIWMNWAQQWNENDDIESEMSANSSLK